VAAAGVGLSLECPTIQRVDPDFEE
jgi:hypothetical protein